MRELIYNFLIEEKYIDKTDGAIAYNEIYLEKDSNTVVLKGNKLGLILLADYLIEIALGEKMGNHAHLDETNFFDKANAELIIAKNDDSLR